MGYCLFVQGFARAPIQINGIASHFLCYTLTTFLGRGGKFKAMRKRLTLIALIISALCTNYSMNAQTLQDVIYLKNGTMIKGLIVEQVPNESIRIKTKDGSIFALQMDSIEKMTKEIIIEEKEYAWKSTQHPHYRGFVGMSYTWSLKEYDEDELDYISLWTSHGVQLNPYLFVGGGVGADGGKGIGIPVFAHVRSDLHRVTNSGIAPYIDIKIGYSVWGTSWQYEDGGNGLYNQNEIGAHFYLGHSKTGISIGITYNLFNRHVRYWYDNAPSYFNKELLSGIGLNVSLDF